MFSDTSDGVTTINWASYSIFIFIYLQERLKQLEAKRIEKERNEKYQKLKGDAKDARSKYREKYKLDASPEPSDAEDESDDDDEDDGFGATKKKEEDLDPAASKSNYILSIQTKPSLESIHIFISSFQTISIHL